MAVITDPFILLIGNVVGGLIIIFLLPPIMKYILNLNVGLAKVGFVKKYWEFILSKKIIQIIGALWIVAAIILFVSNFV